MDSCVKLKYNFFSVSPLFYLYLKVIIALFSVLNKSFRQMEQQ